MSAEKIGETLKRLREKRGKTAADVAEACGISTSAMLMYENGHRIPRDENKRSLAQYYGLTVGELFFDQ